MPGPEPDDGGLWDDLIAAGRGEFTLSAAVHPELDNLSERERQLVDVAITAGIVGALSVLRES